MKEEVLPRSQTPKEYTWNRESVFASEEQWRTAFSKTERMIGELDRYRGRLSQGPELLAECLDLLESLAELGGKVYFYPIMTHYCDTTDQEAAEMAGKVRSLLGKINAARSFLEPELLAIGQTAVEEWMSTTEPLAIYGHFFRDLFRKQAHVRSEEVEELLGLLVTPFATTAATYNMLNNADLTFKPAQNAAGETVALTQGNYFRLLNDGDRELRRTAWENYNDAYLEHKHTFASNLTAAVQQDALQAGVRKYESSLEAALFPDAVPPAVYHNLLEATESHRSLWHRYFTLRKAALGLEQLHPYDIWAPLTGVEHEVTFDQAVEWISEGMKPLGQYYVETLRRGCLEERWVDRYPNLGKQQGAFSFGRPGTHPFIKMSYTDNVKSMSTLAHELGHSMHSYLTWESQPIVYSQYSLFVAEVASNFNQALVRAFLLETIEDADFQIALLEEAMSNFHRYFLIMPSLARFELEIHQAVERGEGLNAEGLIRRAADLFGQAYGPAMEVDQSRLGIGWAQFGHLYRNFYVYQYATGIAGAHALARRVLEGEAGAVEAYLQFLKSGSSGYPLDLLRAAGVDLNSSEPVEQAFGFMSDYIDRLESLTLG